MARECVHNPLRVYIHVTLLWVCILTPGVNFKPTHSLCVSRSSSSLQGLMVVRRWLRWGESVVVKMVMVVVTAVLIAEPWSWRW